METIVTPAGRLCDESIGRKLEQLSEYEEDWDSYGAQEVSSRSIKVLTNFVKRAAAEGLIRVDPSVRPTPNGGAFLAFRLPDRTVRVISDTNEPDLMVVVDRPDESPRVFFGESEALKQLAG